MNIKKISPVIVSLIKPAIVAIIYILIFNVPYLTIEYKDMHKMVKALIGMYFLVFLYIYLAGISIKLYRLIVTLLFSISSLASYFYIFFGIKIHSNTVASFFETDRNEALSVVDYKIVMWIAGFTLAGYIVSRLSYDRSKSIKTTWRYVLPVLLAILFPLREFLNDNPPNNIFFHTGGYFSQKAKLANMEDNYFQPGEIRAKKILSDDPVIVVILGESVRADHLQINGYKKPTTPNIIRTGAVSFPRTIGAGTMTITALPPMLQIKANDKKYLSLPTVLKSAGYYTAWISNQGTYGKHNTPVTIFSKHCDYQYINYAVKYMSKNTRNKFDEYLAVKIDEVLELNNTCKVLFVNPDGSHFMYEDRYPDDFRVFTPVHTSKILKTSKLDPLINSYDNTVLYSDYFYSLVEKQLKDQNAVIYYISDHGQALGENGIFGHGQSEKHQFLINPAMYVWFSDKYKKNNPGKYRNLVKNHLKTIDYTYHFHSIVDIAGIKTPFFDETRSIFNARMKDLGNK